MSQSIAQKILARCAGRSKVDPGEFIWAEVDQTNAGPNHLRQIDQLGIQEVFNPDAVWTVRDHYAPPTDQYTANQDNLLRKYVRQYGISHFFEYGRHGILHQLFGERAAFLPGTLSAMTDSHSTSAGVFNCFATPVGSEVIFILATGQVWLQVPESIRFELSDELPDFCYGKDLALSILRDHGSDVGLYRALEFGGGGLQRISIDSRWTISNMGIEMGATAAIFEYDNRLGEYLA
ncbi:MAG: aconitase family protein, partial [bacterium]